MSLEIEKTKYFNNAFYIFTQPESGPYLHSDILYLDETAVGVKNGILTFKITKPDNENLYNQISEMEEKVNYMVKNLDGEIFYQLPFEMQNRIMQRSVDLDWDCVRPNYFKTPYLLEQPTMFLKGNLPNMMVYNYNGERVPIPNLRSGYYQFMMRTNTVYVGPHKSDCHVANLQLRLVQVRYSPVNPLDVTPSLPLNEDDDSAVSMTTQPATPKKSRKTTDCPPAPKKTRKPRLKRQNAIVDNSSFLNEDSGYLADNELTPGGTPKEGDSIEDILNMNAQPFM